MTALRVELAFTVAYAWDGHGLARGCSAAVAPTVRGCWFSADAVRANAPLHHAWFQCAQVFASASSPPARSAPTTARVHPSGQTEGRLVIRIPLPGSDSPSEGESTLRQSPVYSRPVSRTGSRIARRSRRQPPALLCTSIHNPPSPCPCPRLTHPLPLQSVQVLASDAVARAWLQLTPNPPRSRPKVGTPTPI